MQSRFAHDPSRTRTALDEGVCVSMRVCVATFSGMTPLLEQATRNGKPLPPTSTLLQFELRLRLQLLHSANATATVFIIWPCHLYAPLRLEAVAFDRLLAAYRLLPSSLVLVLNLLPFCNFFLCHFLLFSFCLHRCLCLSFITYFAVAGANVRRGLRRPCWRARLLWLHCYVLYL